MCVCVCVSVCLCVCVYVCMEVSEERWRPRRVQRPRTKAPPPPQTSPPALSLLLFLPPTLSLSLFLSDSRSRCGGKRSPAATAPAGRPTGSPAGSRAVRLGSCRLGSGRLGSGRLGSGRCADRRGPAAADCPPLAPPGLLSESDSDRPASSSSRASPLSITALRRRLLASSSRSAVLPFHVKCPRIPPPPFPAPGRETDGCPPACEAAPSGPLPTSRCLPPPRRGQVAHHETCNAKSLVVELLQGSTGAEQAMEDAVERLVFPVICDVALQDLEDPHSVRAIRRQSSSDSIYSAVQYRGS